MKNFMNFIKRFLVKKKTRDEVVASGEIRALVEVLSLLTLDPYTGFWPTILFYSPVKLAKEMIGGLYLAKILELLQKIRKAKM